MRVAAQQEIEIGMDGLAIDFRRVRNENREFVRRHARGCLLDIVHAVEVSIVDAGDVNPLVAALDRHGLVEQNLDAHVFESWHHQNRIVIAEHCVNRALERSADLGHPSKCRLVGAVSLATIISGQHAQVVVEPIEERKDALHRRPAEIDVQIAQLEDGEAVERRRQSTERDAVMPELDASGVIDATPIKPGHQQTGADQGTRQRQVLNVKEVEAMAENLRLMVLLDAETLPRLAPPEAFLQHR